MSGAHDLAAKRASELRRQRRARYIDHVHKLGARVVFELVDEFAREFGEERIDYWLARFAGLDPAILRALGGDELPARPLRAVGQ
jgi:hypothetical protein